MSHTGHKGHIIVIANQKGGVGKTTTAHALVTGLTYKRYKTLAVDTDPQGNLTYTMNADEDAAGVYELLKGNISALEAVQRTEQGDIISGSLMLSGADMEFSETGREYLLSEALEHIRTAYDFIIIDSPPTLGILTINALTAAHDLIIPMGADAYSIQGLSQLNATIGKVKKRCNPALNIAGLLITRYSGRAILSQELRDAIENKAARAVGTSVFKSVVREGIAIKESQTQQTSLYAATLKSNAAADYLAFIEEYLKGGAKQ
jgi:chromosome partitioning protein